MTNRRLQIICLIAGVAFLALGAGLLGGRIAAQKGDNPPVAPATENASPVVSAPEPVQEEPVRDAEKEADVSDAPPLSEEQPQKAQSEPAQPPTVLRATRPPDTLPVKEPHEATSPMIEKSLAPSQLSPAPVKEAAPSGSPTKYVVQVLSTPNRSDASSARNKIMVAGFPAGVFEADLGERGIWYRIYVGPYDTESEAQAVLESVRTMPEFAASFVKTLE